MLQSCKVGHIAKKCCAKEMTHQVEEPEETLHLNGIHVVIKQITRGYYVDVNIDGHNVTMQLDTGALVSIIPDTIYNKYLTGQYLTEAKPLRSYSGNQLDLLGELEVPVKYESQTMTLPLVVVVVRGDMVPLLGRNWLEQIKLNWSEIIALPDADPMRSLIDKYSSLFEEGDGKTLNMKAHIALRKQAKPIFRKTRPMPYIT